MMKDNRPPSAGGTSAFGVPPALESTLWEQASLANQRGGGHQRQPRLWRVRVQGTLPLGGVGVALTATACFWARLRIRFAGNALPTDIPAMRNWFTFENLPLTLIVALIIWSWISFFSVILFA